MPAQSHVEKLMAECDVITARTLAVEEIRAQHTEVDCRRYVLCDNPRGLCERCQTHMPCPTIAILEKHGLA